jgi:poly(3-hydroxybutyrate) depolymerase
MYEPSALQSPNLAFLWPAFAAASASDAAAFVAKHFANLAVGPAARQVPEPRWSSSHTIALELQTARLRDFTITEQGNPVLLCPPLALHGASVADLTGGHSLVDALRGAGINRLFAADWRSATREMRFLGIDDYLADLNILVDNIGRRVDLVGLCQGGWMAFMYAARFPEKVRKLVLAGAPIDIAAASSALSDLARTTPLAAFAELVRIGDGVVPGTKVLKFWGVESVAAEDLRQVLQTNELPGTGGFAALEAKFLAWYDWTIDLPGAYFLEVVDKLYKRNQLALGKFVALGKRIDPASIEVPIFLLAGSLDELVAPEQLFAVKRLASSRTCDIRTETVACRHIALFMGRSVLGHVWPRIAQWLREPALAPNI